MSMARIADRQVCAGQFLYAGWNGRTGHRKELGEMSDADLRLSRIVWRGIMVAGVLEPARCDAGEGT
ncbi:MAG: hypothetical protein KF693_11770 [Nitrospira sp.]|nr:hypothetical protein [Nitrospira sp.]